MKNVFLKKIASLFLIVVLLFTNTAVYAQETGEVLSEQSTPAPTQEQQQESPAPTQSETPEPTIGPTLPPAETPTPTQTPEQQEPTPTPQITTPPSPTPEPDPQNIKGVSTQKNEDELFPFSSIFPSLSPSASESALSARLKRKTKLMQLLRKTFQANEQLSISVEKDIENSINLTLINPHGLELPVLYSKTQSGNIVSYDITPPQSFVPGKYTIKITDSTGSVETQDFTWGVLAINTNKSIYSPKEKAHLMFAVLDETGNMVCDAALTLSIKKPGGDTDTLSVENKDIAIGPDCQKKAYTPHPDYEGFYTVGEIGRYELTLTANTTNGTYTIQDFFEVRESVPFDVERSGPTRIYPPADYPVSFTIKANQDFDGTVEEIVPIDFTVKKDSETPYDNEFTTSLQDSGMVLGASTADLVMPFEGKQVITTHFGEHYDDRSLTEKILNFGLDGHDGIDFAIPEGTPVVAADSGTVVHAGNKPYGKTVIIQHTWGNTYYGHLSDITVKEGDTVAKAQEVGKSGSTGMSTGPHLHFALSPKGTDENNGYHGKVDPAGYLHIAGESGSSAVLSAQTQYRPDVRVLSWNVSLKKGETKTLKYIFKAPEQSPAFYLLGQLRFIDQKNTANNASANVNTATESAQIVQSDEKNTATQEAGIIPAETPAPESTASAQKREKAEKELVQILQSEGITIDLDKTKEDGKKTADINLPTSSPAVLGTNTEAGVSASQPQQKNNIVFQELRRWQIAGDEPDSAGMHVYLGDGDTKPHYREWSGTDLGNEGNMRTQEANHGEGINAVLRNSPTTDEYIYAAAGWDSTDTNLDVQIFNGTSWIDGTSAPTNGNFSTVLMDSAAGTENWYKPYDVAYEETTGHALVVYENASTSSNATVAYRTWNGAVWSPESTWTYPATANGEIRFVRMAPRPGTDDILTVISDNNSDIKVGMWDGDAFDTNNDQEISTGLSTAAHRPWDLAWESNGNTALIVYGTGTVLDYCTHNGTTCTDQDPTTTGLATIGAVAAMWLELDADKDSDYIALLVSNTQTSMDLYMDLWDGTDWDTAATEPSAESGIEEGAADDITQAFDVAWEQGASTDQVLFVFADDGGTTVDYFIYDISDDAYTCPENGQTVSALASAEGSNGPCNEGSIAFDDDVSEIQLVPSNTDGQIMLTAYNNITTPFQHEQMLWSGANNTWSQTSNQGGITTDLSPDTWSTPASTDNQPHAYAFAWERYSPTLINISGTCDQYDQSTDCSDDGSNEIKVAYDGTVQSTVDTTVDGAWQISSIAAPTSGQVVTIFINGESTASERAVAVTKYDGSGDITGIKLFQRHLVIGSDDNPTVSNTNIGQYDNGVSGDSDIFHEVDSNDDLVVDTSAAYSDEKLYVLSGTTYQPGTGNSSNISTHDFQNLGTTDITANTFTVNGSWTQSGTFSDTCSGTTVGTNASLVTFTSTSSGETLSGTLNSSSDFCKVSFNGSGGGWTIQNAMLVSSPDATDSFTVTTGTVTLGDGTGDDLTVLGTFTVSANGTFQTLSSLPLGSTITVNINTAGGGGSGGCGAASTNCKVALAGSMTINKNATLIFNTTNTSTSTLTSGVDITGTGSLNIIGALDDTGTDTGTDSMTLRETKMCASESWTTDSLNGDYVQLTSGFARGKMYPITDTVESDSGSCATDSHDSITRADTSTTDTTILSVTNNTTNYKVCANVNTQITANNQYTGRYLRDMTGTTGYFLIIKSTNNDATCTGSTDSFVVIPDPDNADSLSALTATDTMDISDGVKSGDTFNVINMATFTGLSTGTNDFTKHAYINTTAAGTTIKLQYAYVNHLGIEGSGKYGINLDTGTMNFATSGQFLVQNSYFSNFRRAIRCNNCANAIIKYNSGVYNNYFDGGATASHTLPYQCVEYSTIGNNEAAGNRCENTYGDTNWSGFGQYSSYKNLWRDNIITNNATPAGSGIRSEVYANSMYLNNRIFNVSTGIENVGGAEDSIIAGNMIFATTGVGIALGTTAISSGWHLAGNIVDTSSTYNLDVNTVTGTIIGANEKYGSYAGATTADVRYSGTGTTTSEFYNSVFGSSTETSNIATANTHLISRKHDQTAGAVQVWNDYVIPADNAETPQDEATEKYNYSNNLYEDSFTPHFYDATHNTGTEDSNLSFSFNGGSLGGSESYYVYRVVCENATCGTADTDKWTVYRTGVTGETSPSKFASVGTATTGTTFTDATTNVVFNIGDAGTDYARSDIYMFVVYADAADSSNQKSITMMQTSDTFTVGSGDTIQLLGSSSSTPTLIQKDSGATSYDFTVSGGTINANYYTFTGLGSAGLSLSSGTITDLDNGIFDDHGDSAIGDAYMTVTNTLLNSTGAQTWTGMQFDPDAVDTNLPTYNVILAANPSACTNAWTFESSGNYGGATNGEASDSDSGDAGACNGGAGYLVWTTTSTGPTIDQLMRHGGWFSNGVEQPFTF